MRVNLRLVGRLGRTKPRGGWRDGWPYAAAWTADGCALGGTRAAGQKQLEKIRNDALRKKKQLKKIRISSPLGIA